MEKIGGEELKGGQERNARQGGCGKEGLQRSQH